MQLRQREKEERERQKKEKKMKERERKKKAAAMKGLELHERIKRAATARPERIWDYGVIPYEIEANFSGTFFFYCFDHFSAWVPSYPP